MNFNKDFDLQKLLCSVFILGAGVGIGLGVGFIALVRLF